MKSRRDFFKVAGTGLLAAGIGNSIMASPVSEQKKKAGTEDLFKIGMAGFTLREFTVDEAFEYLKRINVLNLSVKDMHLAMNSTQEQVNEFLAKAKAAGINIYTLGVIYMKDEATVNLAFDYAKKAGVNMIVCAPSYDLLPQVEKKVIETNIRVAIHNHGPEDKLYPSPEDVYTHVKNMDKRMGLCIDIGHTMRNGVDPSEALEKYIDRVFDIHIKDETEATKDGKTIEIGRGVIDFPKFIRTLRKTKYSGMCSIEFEKGKTDVIPGVAESIGFFKGVMKSI